MMDFNIEHINLHRNRNYVFIKWALRNFGHSCPFTSKNMFRFFFLLRRAVLFERQKRTVATAAIAAAAGGTVKIPTFVHSVRHSCTMRPTLYIFKLGVV